MGAVPHGAILAERPQYDDVGVSACKIALPDNAMWPLSHNSPPTDQTVAMCQAQHI